MSGHQTEAVVLRHIVLYADRDGCRKLEKSIAQVEHDTNCVQRVASLTALFGTLLVPLLPMVARGADINSTYGQRIVAAVLMGEARGEGEIGMAAVAEVIRNRANAASRSPLAIVLKKGEFACLNDTTPEALHRKFYRMKTYPMALRIAKTCYNTPEQLPNVTKGATFFDSMKKDRPPWLGDVQLVTTIGNHRFYVPK
jgi:N-acetylmuramoyl-L-alanine amidase